jgi:integrase
VSEITSLDVLEIINAKKRHAPAMAGALLTMLRRSYNWVIDQQVYGLIVSPCDRLKSAKLIGPPPARTRRLNDTELFAFWRAAGRLGYPAGPAYQLLLLTGLRLYEAARLSWPEIEGDVIVVPAARMKGRNDQARDHLVPLSGQAQKIIASLPRIKGGPFLFSRDAGKRPAAMTNEIKRTLDRRMLLALRALARRDGEDHTQVTLPPWTNHDLRRVVRSGLSQLRVPFVVAEAVLAHRQRGVAVTYDLHEYVQEKREALVAWAQRLGSIVNPMSDNVIALRARR